MDRAAFNEKEKILPLQNQDRISEVWWVAELCFQSLNMGFANKKRFGMLLVNKSMDEIEVFGGSQEAWGNPFLFDLNKCKTGFLGFLQRSPYSVHSLCFVLHVARPSVEMVSRFLGFSLRNFWSLGDAEDSGEDRRLQGRCAQLPRGVFGSLSLWKSGIPDVKNGDLTINNGVISAINMESLLIQSTIRVGFGEILILTMVYTIGGSWKSIG